MMTTDREQPATPGAHDVCAYLLQRAGSLTTMQLHKLCYSAQGWHLAWNDRPLFSDRITAVGSGLAVEALFEHHNDGPIADSWPPGDASTVQGGAADTVDAIYGSYRHLTGLSMSEQTREQAPWLNARAKTVDGAPAPEITHADMRAFFRAIEDAPLDQTSYANRFINNYR